MKDWYQLEHWKLNKDEKYDGRVLADNEEYAQQSRAVGLEAMARTQRYYLERKTAGTAGPSSVAASVQGGDLPASAPPSPPKS